MWIFEDGALVAAHPSLEGRDQSRVDPAHRKMPRIAGIDDGQRRAVSSVRTGDRSHDAPLDFYDAVGRRLACQGGAAMSATLRSFLPSSTASANSGRLEDAESSGGPGPTVRRLERGEITAMEAIDTLFAEELTLRENRRMKMALMMARALHHQDARRLRLLVPAFARSQPHHGTRPAGVHRS